MGFLGRAGHQWTPASSCPILMTDHPRFTLNRSIGHAAARAAVPGLDQGRFDLSPCRAWRSRTSATMPASSCCRFRRKWRIPRRLQCAGWKSAGRRSSNSCWANWFLMISMGPREGVPFGPCSREWFTPRFHSMVGYGAGVSPSCMRTGMTRTTICRPCCTKSSTGIETARPRACCLLARTKTINQRKRSSILRLGLSSAKRSRIR